MPDVTFAVSLDAGPAQQALVRQLIAQRLPHASAVAFGSRVVPWPFGRGPKTYSDLDIALWGLRPTDAAALAHLRADLEESSLPWRVDLSREQDLFASLRALVQQRGLLFCGQPLPSSAAAQSELAH